MQRRRFAILCAAAVGLFGLAATPAAAAQGWLAVLVAGDYAQPVFDDGVVAMRQWLLGNGVPQDNIRRLTAARDALDPVAEAASAQRILRDIATLSPRPGERCLVFITSHGQRGRGVWLAYSGEILQPAALARALSMGCGGVPTVVIVSACYSGSFTAPPMAARNRIILTAARADRPSFGCQADRTYTVYDECLLAAVPRAATWRAVFDATGACVHRRERELDALPSVPQAYFGAAVRDLPVR